MNNFVERLKTDKILQIIFVFALVIILVFLYFIFKPKKAEIPCYKVKIKIWAPFESYELYPYLKDFEKFCVSFEVENKSFDDIKSELIPSLAENNNPDIVLIDDVFVSKYKKVFATVTPLFIDSLVAFYNQDIVNFLGLKKPKTFDELKNFRDEIKKSNQPIEAIGLGTENIKNRKEIILTLFTLNSNYKDLSNFKQNLINAINFYKSFSNPLSELFIYNEKPENDLENFAKEKIVSFIGFYEDKDEILKINPRLNFSIDQVPLNTFPPRAKVYTKVYYLGVLRSSNKKAFYEFIKWFKKYKGYKLAQDFDRIFVESNLDKLPYEKRIVFETFKNFGENFEFLDKNLIFNNLDSLLKSYGKDEKEFSRVLDLMSQDLSQRWKKE
jgi:ABC-type glycerol-3-phosphate transport system substrate-binding protein